MKRCVERFNMRKTSNPSLISLEEVDLLKINDDFEKVFNKYNLFSGVATGGMGGSGPHFCSDPSWD